MTLEEKAEEYARKTLSKDCCDLKLEVYKRTINSYLAGAKEVKADCDFALEGKDVEIKELREKLAKSESQRQRNQFLYSCVNTKRKCFDCEVGCPCNKYKRTRGKIAELEQKLEQTEKDLADYQFNYPKIKELEQENAELKKTVEHYRKEREFFIGEVEK